MAWRTSSNAFIERLRSGLALACGEMLAHRQMESGGCDCGGQSPAGVAIACDRSWIASKGVGPRLLGLTYDFSYPAKRDHTATALVIRACRAGFLVQHPGRPRPP